mgnify:CR=1 FL=1
MPVLQYVLDADTGLRAAEKAILAAEASNDGAAIAVPTGEGTTWVQAVMTMAATTVDAHRNKGLRYRMVSSIRTIS